MSKSLVKRGDPMRDVVAVSQSNLMQAVTRFGQYIDQTGAKASSERGLVMSINSAIKRHYGCSRDEMAPDMLLHCSSALVGLIGLIDSGIRDGRDRADIKAAIRATIKAGGESYHTMQSAQHAHAA